MAFAEVVPQHRDQLIYSLLQKPFNYSPHYIIHKIMQNIKLVYVMKMMDN